MVLKAWPPGPGLFFSPILSAACSSLAAAARLSLRAWRYIFAQHISTVYLTIWLGRFDAIVKRATGKKQQRLLLLLLRGLVVRIILQKNPRNIVSDMFVTAAVSNLKLKPLPRWRGRAIARPGSGVPQPHGRSLPGCLPQRTCQQKAGRDLLRVCRHALSCAQDRAHSPKCKIAWGDGDFFRVLDGELVEELLEGAVAVRAEKGRRLHVEREDSLGRSSG